MVVGTLSSAVVVDADVVVPMSVTAGTWVTTGVVAGPTACVPLEGGLLRPVTIAMAPTPMLATRARTTAGIKVDPVEALLRMHCATQCGRTAGREGQRIG